MQNQTLGKYRILEEIGRGGFATVYQAEDTTLEREVALKVLAPLLMQDETFVARFQREARAAARLEHPHIVPIYEVGGDEERLFIAMRLIRGASLAHRLKEKGRMTWEETLNILREVASALEYAHAEGIIHRDIKPDNILLDGRSGAMLSDFGFARLIGTSSMTQSVSGGIVGTPAYIPPEIWEGKEATFATDVYALSCVVYEMLLGNTLFFGETPMAVMRLHDQGARIPDTWPIDVPPDIGNVMAKALARQPQARYATVHEFLSAMEALQTAAIAERITQEVERLYADMQAALSKADYASAVELGQRLLELRPDHKQGAALLGQAQAWLARKQDLTKQLTAVKISLEEQQEALVETRTLLDEQLSAIVERRISLQDEQQKLETRLQALRQALTECDTEDSQLAEQTVTMMRQMNTVQQLEQQLLEADTMLRAGDLDKVEWAIRQIMEVELDRELGSGARMISVENVADIQLLCTLKQHTGPVRCVRFSPDGTLFASGSVDGRVHLWRAVDAKTVGVLRGERGEIADLAFSPDGEILAAAGHGIQFWRVSDGTLIQWLNIVGTNVAVNKDDMPLATGQLDSIPIISSLTYSPDGKLLVFGAEDGNVRVWSCAQERLLQVLRTRRLVRGVPVHHVALSSDSQMVAACAKEHVIRVWRWGDSEIASQILSGHTDIPLCLAFDVDGNLLASGGEDATLRLWRMPEGEQFRVGKHQAAVSAVAFSTDGDLLVSSSLDNSVLLWSAKDGKGLRTLKTEAAVNDIAFCSQRALLALGMENGAVQLWGI